MAYGYIKKLNENVERTHVRFNNRYGIALAADLYTEKNIDKTKLTKLFFIRFYNICPVEKIVNTCIVDICQFTERFGCHGIDTVFISGISASVDMQQIGNLLLCHVFIFPKVFDSVVNHTHHRVYYKTP